MNKHLILLATAFPYGNGEAYLETEVQYYDSFESVKIFSLNIHGEQRNHIRTLPDKRFQVFPIFRGKPFVYPLYAVRALFDRNLYAEIGQLRREKRFNFKRLVRLFIYMSRAHRDAGKIRACLKKYGNDLPKEDGILYSYRFEYQAYTALLVQKFLPGYKTVARGHRYDLYEERNADKYIPLRRVLMRELDRIVMIAEDGKKYLSAKFPEYADKIVVSRLGTATYPITKTPCPRGTIHIVSCSNVVPVKRLDLIVKSLSLVKGIRVKWTHYGDGESLSAIKQLCGKTLGENITYDFRSSVPNAQILEDYAKTGYHLFLNVSESEGIPVSIMEATSFGIPCIATDVGGTNEIIETGKNGILLDKDFSPEELAAQIKSFAEMDDITYQEYRHDARAIWENKYSADKNYPAFVNLLQNDMK